jgi:hypothetical protein
MHGRFAQKTRPLRGPVLRVMGYRRHVCMWLWLWQGEHHKKKSLKDIEQSWREQQAASLGKRESKQRTTTFAGETVLASSMSAEGVGGLYSGLKSTANSIHSGRDKKRFVHDSICHYCKDGGDLVCCPHCPRCYHMEVLLSIDARLARNSSARLLVGCTCMPFVPWMICKMLKFPLFVCLSVFCLCIHIFPCCGSLAVFFFVPVHWVREHAACALVV